jgi:hypothetical protein
MKIQKRTLGWLPKPSLYNEMAAKRAKQKANHQAFINSTSGLTGIVSGIMANKTAEMTNIVATVALARINKKA